MNIAHEQAQEEFLRTMPHLLGSYYGKLKVFFNEDQAFTLVREYQQGLLATAMVQKQRGELE